MKVLYISHYFPPCGGAGVQRTAKFVKYLPDFGVEPIILTGVMNLDDRWSPEDQSLLADIPESISKYRVTETPTNVFNEERIDALIAKGREALTKEKPDLILVTLSPFSDARVAAQLSKEYEIPWVADLRDPWALDEFQVHKSFLHLRTKLKLMRNSLASSSGIIMNTPVAKELLLNEFPEFESKNVTSITNGYDAEESFLGEKREPGQKFKIVHTGAFHTHTGLHQRNKSLLYKLLGRTAPDVALLPRSPYYLLKALEAIQRNKAEVMSEIEVVFVGVLSDADTELIKRSPVASLISTPGYVDHTQSVDYVRNADLLFLPLHKRGAGKRASIVPGKAYEYMASGNPVLGALPEGDARDYLEAAGNSYLARPDDVEALESGIMHFFDQWKSGTISYCRRPESIGQFERKNLTETLVSFLRETRASALSRETN